MVKLDLMYLRQKIFINLMNLYRRGGDVLVEEFISYSKRSI
jgi:hypothetical protein